VLKEKHCKKEKINVCRKDDAPHFEGEKRGKRAGVINERCGIKPQQLP